MPTPLDTSQATMSPITQGNISMAPRQKSGEGATLPGRSFKPSNLVEPMTPSPQDDSGQFLPELFGVPTAHAESQTGDVFLGPGQDMEFTKHWEQEKIKGTRAEDYLQVILNQNNKNDSVKGFVKDYMDSYFQENPSASMEDAARSAINILAYDDPNHPEPIKTYGIADHLTFGSAYNQRLASDLQGRATDIVNYAKDIPENPALAMGLPAAVVGQGAGVIGDVAKEALAEVPEPIQKGANWLQNLMISGTTMGMIKPEQVQMTKDAIGSIVSPALDTLKQKHPNAALLLDSVINAGLMVVGNKPVQEGVNATAKGLSNTREGIMGTSPKNIANKIQRSVQPEVTQSVLDETMVKNPNRIVDEGLLKRGYLEPTTYEKGLAKEATGIKGYEKASTPRAKAKLVQTDLERVSNELRSDLEKFDNNKLLKRFSKLPHSETMKAVRTDLAEVQKGFQSNEGAFNLAGDVAEEMLAKYPETMAGTDAARVAFDTQVEARLGERIWQKGTPQAMAWKTARNAFNKAIEAQAQKAGTSYQPQLDQMTARFDILENLATQKGKGVLDPTILKILKKPMVKFGLGVGAVTLGGQQLFNKIGIPGFAEGGITETPKVLVGEEGPEVVELPIGSEVHPTDETEEMLGGDMEDDDLIESAKEMEIHDHPEIAAKHPEIIAKLVEDEIRDDPVGYKNAVKKFLNSPKKK
jgi:hypothetical protein